ncbi:MAG: DUF5329 family protein [Candidatus Binatia bacterium]
MRNIIKLTLLFLILAKGVAAAELPESEKLKIQYLKEQIATSQCQFERNGKVYAAEDALAHIEKKHRYFTNDIDSVEKFIELAASKSTVSHKPYYLHCPGKDKVSAAQWLMKRLDDWKGPQ